MRRNVHHNSMATSNHMAISNEQSRGTHSYSRHNQSTQGHGGQHQDGSKGKKGERDGAAYRRANRI